MLASRRRSLIDSLEPRIFFTATTIATTMNGNITLGQSVVATATVTPVTPGGPTPTGTVTFTELVNAVSIGTQVEMLQADGTAVLPFTPYVQGYFSTTAVYSGDENYDGATTAVGTVTNVNTAPETVVLDGNAYPHLLVTSQKATAKEPVLISNPTSSEITGKNTISIFTLSTAGVTALIGSVKQNFKIAPGQTKKYILPINLARMDGSPNVSALTCVVTGPTGLNSFGYNLNGIVVAAPFVALSATLQGVTPSTLGAKARPFFYNITLTDTGTAAASGTVTFVFEGFNAQYPVGTFPTVTVFSKTKIKAGKTTKIHLKGQWPGDVGLLTGSYDLAMSATLDGVTATAVSQTPYIVT